MKAERIPNPHTTIPREISEPLAALFAVLVVTTVANSAGLIWAVVATVVSAGWLFHRVPPATHAQDSEEAPASEVNAPPLSAREWKRRVLDKYGCCVPILSLIEYASEWIQFYFKRWAFIPVTSAVAMFAGFVAFWAESDERSEQRKRSAYLAFDTLGTLETGSVRRNALEDLVRWRENLFEVDLSHELLASANLSRGRLVSADLSGSVLYSANLKHARLRGADLSGADLSRADLSGAHLHRADLSEANLNAAHLSSACMNHADLSDANLSGTDLSNANLRRADLSDANLSGAILNNADLSRANLSDSDLSGADLRGADLSGVRWQPMKPPIGVPQLVARAAFKYRWMVVE